MEISCSVVINSVSTVTLLLVLLSVWQTQTNTDACFNYRLKHLSIFHLPNDTKQKKTNNAIKLFSRVYVWVTRMRLVINMTLN